MGNDECDVEEFDLEPDPRILPMLGEINLDRWRCIAEFIDNSIDSFLNSKEEGIEVEDLEVSVTLPMANSEDSRLVIRDNGQGMTPDRLEQAVRAGWSGNDPIHRLGLFGMGFNIATARLGSITTVWTTRNEDAKWYGLKIDFNELQRQHHFKTPRITREKIEADVSGTEIVIESIKSEHLDWFSRSHNRTRIKKQLSRAYSSMLGPNGDPIALILIINGIVVEGRQHCIWGGPGNPERIISSNKWGNVHAFQRIDERLANRPYCTRCWQWLSNDREACTTCGTSDNIVNRERRIYGWLGIQRYLHSSEYGIDFLRHGRKIEIANKDLFQWNDEEFTETEYPIDDPRHRGRIVGEVHIDHCRISYTKDRFERSDPVWEDMVRIVRGVGPIRPDKAREMDFGPNTSPLFLLFQIFRRSSPKPKVAGAYKKLLIVQDNTRAESMAKKFYAGETDYITDQKWWDLVEESDNNLLTPPTSTGEDDDTGSEGFLDGDEDDTGSGDEATGDDIIHERTVVPSLSTDYRHDKTNQQWIIQAYEVKPNDPILPNENTPWVSDTEASGHTNFYYNPRHMVFRSMTMTPLDGLLSELAWLVMDFYRDMSDDITFASVLYELRDAYATPSKIDTVTLSSLAQQLLKEIAGSIARYLDEDDAVSLYHELKPSEQEDIIQKMAVQSVRDHHNIINQGRFLEYAKYKTLAAFFLNHPDLFFDGKCWEDVYTSLDYPQEAANAEARRILLRHYSSLLIDAIWLAEQDPSDLEDSKRERLLRSALSLDLLEPTYNGGGE